MSIQLFLAEDQLAVDRHFKHAAARRNDLPLRDLKLELFQNFARQPDGFVGVASLRAIFKRDVQLIHRSPYFSNKNLPRMTRMSLMTNFKIRVIRDIRGFSSARFELGRRSDDNHFVA